MTAACSHSTTKEENNVLTIIIVMLILQTALIAAILWRVASLGREEKKSEPGPVERSAVESEEERAFREGLRNLMRYGGEI